MAFILIDVLQMTKDLSEKFKAYPIIKHYVTLLQLKATFFASFSSLYHNQLKFPLYHVAIPTDDSLLSLSGGGKGGTFSSRRQSRAAGLQRMTKFPSSFLDSCKING